MLVLLLVAVGQSHAMSAYARNFNMKCSECHKQRIPELNDFGIAFYKNGFNLPGTQQGKPAKPAEEEGGSAAPADSSDTPPEKTAAGTAGMPDQKGETPTPVPPPETLVIIYQGQSADGSVYFTDNPLNKRLQDTERKTSHRRPVRPAVVRQTAKTTETAAPPNKPAAPGYRSYQECMERQLQDAPAGTAQQMMDLFMLAEGACTAFPQRNP